MTTEAELRVKAGADTTGLQKGMSDGKKSVQDFANASSIGIRKLENTFQDMGIQALGVTGPVARLGDALLEFVPGGAVGAGVIGGIGAMILALKHFVDEQKKVKEATADLAIKITDQNISYIKLTEGIDAATKAQLNFNIAIAQGKIKEATADLAKLEEDMRRRAAARSTMSAVGPGFAGEAGGAATRGRQAITQEEALAQIRKSNALNQLSAMDRLVAANKELLDAQSELRNFEQRTAADAAKARQDAADDAIKKAKEAQDAVEKAQRAAYDRFTDLFKLSNQGYSLSIPQQQELTLLTGTYNNLLNDTNATLEQRMYALDAIGQIQKANEEREKKAEEERKKREEEKKKREQEIEDKMKKASDDEMSRQEKIRSYYEAASDAIQVMLSAIGEGGRALTNIGTGLLNISAGLFKSKAAENIAFALENFAKAAGYLAVGNLPGAAIARKAAGTHLLAAAKFSVLAGAASAGSGAIGANNPGAAGNGGGFSNSIVGRNTFFPKETVTIIVQGGSLLDMSNPDTQRSFVGALETVTNRRANFRLAGV